MAEITAAVRHSALENDDSPGTTSPVVDAMAQGVEICRDVYGGTLALRAKPGYLPQFPKEEDAAYARRLGQAVLFNAFRKTVKGLTGMVFRKDPVIGEDVPESIVEHLENVDLQGRHVAVFLRDAFRSKLIDGHGCILVDWHGAEGAQSALDEIRAEARPYWVWIEKRQILRFRTANRNGAVVLTSFAYLEDDTQPKGAFGEVEIERVRQFDMEGEKVLYRSWTRIKGEGGQWQPEVEEKYLGPRMTRIPVVPDYADRSGFLTSEPPLLDLALENLEHYQMRSERRQSLGIGSIPVFVTKGVKAQDIGTFTVGGAIGLALPASDMDAGYVETAGTAFDATRDELKDIEQRMAALGLSMLQQESRAAETAEAKRLDKSEQDSELSNAARSTQDAAEEALILHAMWMGLPEGVAGSITVNRDFDSLVMDAQTLNVIQSMVPHKISVDTMWDMMVAGELLPDDFDREAERARLDESGAAELAAVAEALRAERMRQEPVEQDTDDMEDAA